MKWTLRNKEWSMDLGEASKDHLWIRVFPHYSGASIWCVTCEDIYIVTRNLTATDAESAKAEALDYVHAKLERLLALAADARAAAKAGV